MERWITRSPSPLVCSSPLLIHSMCEDGCWSFKDCEVLLSITGSLGDRENMIHAGVPVG